MKIKPIQIWQVGQMKTGDTLNLYVVSDNLKDSATFYFSIGSENEILTQGNLAMSGDTYQGWETNEYAWNWAAGVLGVDILPEQPEQSVEA